MSDEIEVSDYHDYEEEDREQMQMHYGNCLPISIDDLYSDNQVIE